MGKGENEHMREGIGASRRRPLGGGVRFLQLESFG